MALNPSSPAIIIIDDDQNIGRTLSRIAAKTFQGYHVRYASNGVVGLEFVQQLQTQIKLVVLDVHMPLLDGRLVAAQIRAMLPNVPILPFSAYSERMDAMVALGCLPPVVKHPSVFENIGVLMEQAMTTVPAPLPDTSWVETLRQSGDLVLEFVRTQVAGHGPSLAGGSAQVTKAIDLLDQYCRRARQPARELILARRALAELAAP